jgi:hypothetical protein
MSVNINFKPSSNESKWEYVKSGDFVILEGTPEHPIPNDLYRVFIISEDGPPAIRNVFIIPMSSGPFTENMFPYMLSAFPYPTIIQKVNAINIEVEVNK